MATEEENAEYLRRLPSVDAVLQSDALAEAVDAHPRWFVLSQVRAVLEQRRTAILAADTPAALAELDLTVSGVARDAADSVIRRGPYSLRPVINATGVVLHTNLGRALLSSQTLRNLQEIGGGYSCLELDLETGERGLRYSHVEPLMCRLSGAESALVVNNNAGAVLLCCETLARGREVVVSRGEMIEIGGAFRIPEVIEKSGAILRDVGTTNRTHLRDYASAINDRTGLLLKVHPSNYRILGFTAEVSLQELVALGRERGVPVMEDLGSGNLIDFGRYQAPFREPTVRESVKAGADVVTFSGDKLLGGPQAGIIVGGAKYLDEVKRNPLNRALRIDKLTLAALEATLAEYLDEERLPDNIPTLRMLLMPLGEIDRKAKRLVRLLRRHLPGHVQLELVDDVSEAGGGALPTLSLPTRAVALEPTALSAQELERRLRLGTPAVIARIVRNRVHVDLRTVEAHQIRELAQALVAAASGPSDPASSQPSRQ